VPQHSSLIYTLPNRWQRSYFVTSFAFVGLVLGFVLLLLKLGVCCKSLIKNMILRRCGLGIRWSTTCLVLQLPSKCSSALQEELMCAPQLFAPHRRLMSQSSIR
jgi:hypothetical protein